MRRVRLQTRSSARPPCHEARRTAADQGPVLGVGLEGRLVVGDDGLPGVAGVDGERLGHAVVPRPAVVVELGPGLGPVLGPIWLRGGGEVESDGPLRLSSYSLLAARPLGSGLRVEAGVSWLRGVSPFSSGPAVA